VLLDDVERATSRLLATAGSLDADPSAPSLLPGWTRGHLLTHVARNADSLVNLLTWARTGVVTPQYPSAGQREADIAAGADRPWTVLVADVRESADRFAKAAATLSTGDWAVHLDLPNGPQPAALVPWRRLREVEVHHVDLAGGLHPPGTARGGRNPGRRGADRAPGRSRAPDTRRGRWAARGQRPGVRTGSLAHRPRRR